jgi:uncharacterized membrane protein YphA (DoxX/SURF4 family)
MNTNPLQSRILLSRWTLGIVVLLESIEFVFSASVAHFLAKTGLPSWVRPVLGGAEIIAAVLFLVPYTARAGSYLLLVIFALAAAVHVLHGRYGVGGLVVYAAAVIVCMGRQENMAADLPHERL